MATRVSREIKILLIVLGSLFALAIVGIVALVLTLPHFLKSIATSGVVDPAAARRTAAKIATFDLPRGYRYGTVSDFGLTELVTVVPKHRRRGTYFQMQLQGTIASSGTDASAQGMKLSMGIMSKLTSCDMKDGTDDVMVRGVSVKLAVMQCTNASFPFRVESGVFPGNAAQATITAMGDSNSFDTKALHALLASVR